MRLDKANLTFKHSTAWPVPCLKTQRIGSEKTYGPKIHKWVTNCKGSLTISTANVGSTRDLISQTSTMFAHFKEYNGNHKNFKSLCDFGGRCTCLKIRDVCMEFEPCFKVHSLVSVHPKSIILGKMTNLNMIFHVMVSVYRFVKIWNSPLFTAE